MKTAMLIIDVQKSLVDEGVWDADRVIDRLNLVGDMARDAGAPVVIVRDAGVQPDPSLHPRVKSEPDDPDVVKQHGDAFKETPLQSMLKERGINRVVIGGMQTDYCVKATVEGAAALGYDICLIADGHSTLDGSNATAAEIIEHTNDTFAGMSTSAGSVRVLPAGEVTFD